MSGTKAKEFLKQLSERMTDGMWASTTALQVANACNESASLSNAQRAVVLAQVVSHAREAEEIGQPVNILSLATYINSCHT